LNHEELKLESVSKLFEFEKISRELDTCTNIDLLRNICADKGKKNMFLFEIINLILNKYTIPAIQTQDKFVKIESCSDLEGLQ
jgi:hypothetical protein